MEKGDIIEDHHLREPNQQITFNADQDLLFIKAAIINH